MELAIEGIAAGRDRDIDSVTLEYETGSADAAAVFSAKRDALQEQAGRCEFWIDHCSAVLNQKVIPEYYRYLDFHYLKLLH